MTKVRRLIEDKVLELAGYYPVVTITGPRQSGKTTLVKLLFNKKEYVSLENMSNRTFADADPEGFLEKYSKGAVIDEIQRAPDLVSYIQTNVDENDSVGRFILTGSQQFEVMHKVSQSLAGRTGIIRLLPFCFDEIYRTSASPEFYSMLFTGFYPRIFDKRIPATEAMSTYVSTYIERDLRLLLAVKDLSSFEVFLKLCAGRTGQVLNLSSLANDCGVSHNTIKQWISILETSYIVRTVRPFYKNFNKRLVKAPKLYFLDTGLVCFLLGIREPLQIEVHPLRGAIFETYVYGELLKARYNAGDQDNIYYYRDNTGNEVDFILDNGAGLSAVEVKSSRTMSHSFFKSLSYFEKIASMPIQKHLVYAGKENHVQSGVTVTSWNRIYSRVV